MMLRKYFFADFVRILVNTDLALLYLFFVRTQKYENFFEEFIYSKEQSPFLSFPRKITTRTQTKKKEVEDLVSANLGTPMSGGNQHENLVAGTSKSRKLQSENLDEIKSSLRKEIMSYFTKTLAENQMEMLKLIAPTAKKN